MTPEEYEARQEAKRERLRARAASKRAAANAADAAARGTLDRIPMGQPILVGHHSEKRHRRDLARADQNLRKAIDADNEAARLESRAANLGTSGISSDDPSAIEKLQAQLVDLEAQREAAKKVNAAVRKAYKNATKTADKPDLAALIEEVEMPDWARKWLRMELRAFPYLERAPQLDLKNTGANIRRIKQRIKSLQATAEREPATPATGEGWRIEECPDDNRVRVFFDDKPPRETCKLMRQYGFKWARSVGAWQRMLNEAGCYAAQCVARKLQEAT
jgi:hypothetical protein